MRRLIADAVVGLLVAAGLTVVLVQTAPSAWADECPEVDENGICLEDVDNPLPDPDNPDRDNPLPDPDNPALVGGSTCPGAPGGRCTDAAGNYWNSEHDCYAAVRDPQPGPQHPTWDANNISPADGQFWWCITGPGTGAVWFVENGDEPRLVDGAAIAQQLVLRAPFEVADLAMAPPFDFHTYIRIDNWFWVPEAQWHDVSLTEDLGPASVTLTATPSRLEVETGDGAPATNCYDPGRVWKPGMTDAATTTCSYAYPSIDNPAGSSYTVVGRLHYEISWTCTGLCSAPAGELGEYAAPDSTANQIEVRQRQTVVTQ